MNILSLSSCALDPMLGSGKTRLRWSQGLRALGHTVELLEPRDYESFYGMKRGRRFRQAWGACSAVKGKLPTTNYDLIDFCGGEFGLITWLLSRKAHRPLLVAHTDGLELLSSERKHAYSPATTPIEHVRRVFAAQTHDRLSRAAFAHADAFVTLCELDRDYVVQHGLFEQGHTEVISPGLDVEYLARPFRPDRDKEHCVAYTGSWSPRKGVARLVEVMSRVLTRDQSLRFDVYGAKREAVLGSFSQALHSRIVVHGRLSNEELADGMSKARVFFFPTQYEGFGMALAEAMACSCAAVTTPTGFGAELSDGNEVLICGFEDPAAMEHAVVTLLDNEALRSDIALKGWKRVRTLNWETNVKRLESVYLRWLARPRRDPADVLSAAQ